MKNFLYSLFIGLFGIAALTSIAFLLMYAAQSKQQAHLYSDLAAVRKQDTQQETASEPEKQASYQNLYWENTDMVGWILIEDTNIDYPVMQTPTDPTYYLKHDFEKNYTDYGCPFTQANCDALCPSDNLIIYGHNMNSGAMFGNLDQYASYDYWKAHPRVFFQTPGGMEEYRIAAVLKADVSMFDFQQISFQNQREAEAYVEQAKELALFETGVDGTGCEKL